MPVNTYITANGRIRRRITTKEAGIVTDDVAVVTNALGSVVATYKDGWLTADRSYDPYGETRAEWNDVGRFGWVGGLGYRETRREWVSHYVRARHYGFPMGMWASVDPLWPEEAAFGYVGGQALSMVDPTGLRVQFCKGPIFGGAHHWFLRVENPRCPAGNVRIDYWFFGARATYDTNTTELGPTGAPASTDKCFDIPATPTQEACLCSKAHYVDRSKKSGMFPSIGGKVWKPHPRGVGLDLSSHPAKVCQAMDGDVKRGEYNLLGHNCQDFVNALLRDCKMTQFLTERDMASRSTGSKVGKASGVLLGPLGRRILPKPKPIPRGFTMPPGY